MYFNEIREMEDACQVASYAKLGIAVERGKGTSVWTAEGDEYLDLYGGHAVCATGHSHPLVVKAIADQAERVLFYSNLVYSSVRARAASKLASVAPGPLSKVFFCNSGTEANENAMRMARLVTGREKIVTFGGGFHGRTADSISATFLGRYRELGKPNVPGHVGAEFGNIASVAAVADGNTAAVMLEPIQSMAGIVEASPEFFRDLRSLCDEKGILLIFDEVQTGVGRTGDWCFSGSEHAGEANADIVTLAKSLGSGIPVGACLVTDEVSEPIKSGDLGTTFGGGMLAMAAVEATLEAIEEDGMLESAVSAEKTLRTGLAGIEGVRGVRGKGCLLGIELERLAKEVNAALLERKIITGTSSDPHVLRLLMPLCVGAAELAHFIETLREVL